MEEKDLKSERPDLYRPMAGAASIVEVPPFKYIMFDGQGAPDGDEALTAYDVLFAVANKVKYMKSDEYARMPLEGLFWADDLGDLVAGRRDRWKWTFMIRVPDAISENDFSEVIADIRARGGLSGLNRVRFGEYSEGAAAQILHVGPLSDLGADMLKVEAAIKAAGGMYDGHSEKHHEIYLSDMRRTDPAKIEAILRQPFHK